MIDSTNIGMSVLKPRLNPGTRNREGKAPQGAVQSGKTQLFQSMMNSVKSNNVLPYENIDKVNNEVLNQNINVQLYEILKQSNIDYNTMKIMMKHKWIVSKNFKNNQKILKDNKVKEWRVKRHMMMHKDLNKDYRTKLRGYYNNIVGDGDAAEGIGADELEDPLITLGITKNRQEVDDIFSGFKTHVKGVLNFEEFIEILNGNKIQKRGGASSTAILEFFRNMIEGNLNTDIASSDTLPFNMTVSSLRRKKLLEMMVNNNKMDKTEMISTMNSFGRLVHSKKSAGHTGMPNRKSKNGNRNMRLDPLATSTSKSKDMSMHGRSHHNNFMNEEQDQLILYNISK